MLRINVAKPDCCPICGYYLTIIEKYAGSRCLDPAHWQAAGLLSPTDFYPMACIAAQANAEQNRRLEIKTCQVSLPVPFS